MTRMVSAQDNETQGILPWPGLAFFSFTKVLFVFLDFFVN